MNGDDARRRDLGIAIVVFVGILLVVVVDLATDYHQGVGTFHVVAEGAVIALSIAGVAVLGRRYAALRTRTERLRRELEDTREDAERWRREAEDVLEGLGEAIDRQFERWELTPAEREVALLLLKGFSHKEIADIRDVSDRTVRQQAHAVYDKGNLDGRAQLSAFFLEDLLVPSLEPIRDAREENAEQEA
jgi:DNA-binding CsgD family transcriptional regulator